MKEHKHGGDIYSQKYRVDFSSNINPLGPPSGVVEAVFKSAEQIMHYPDVECRALRKAVAEHEYVKEEDLLFGNGAAELIFAYVFAKKPKKALLLSPCFAEYEEALRAVGCAITYFPVSSEEGFKLTDRFLDAISEDIDVLMICNPNNPTGTVICEHLMLRILDQCKKYQVSVLLDECFNEFLDAPDSYSMKTFLNRYSNLFILNAFTKTYAMPGLRLGYGITKDTTLIPAMQAVVQPWSVSIPAQMAGVAAIAEDAYVYQSRWLVKEERRFLKEGLKRFGFEVYDSKANYVFFKGQPGLTEPLREKGILIRDCSNYTNLTPGYYRIAVRRRDENKELLKAMKEFFEESEAK